MIVWGRMGSASKGTECKFRNKHANWYFSKRVTYTHIDEWWLKMDVNLCFKVMVINLDCQLDGRRVSMETRLLVYMWGCFHKVFKYLFLIKIFCHFPHLPLHPSHAPYLCFFLYLYSFLLTYIHMYTCMHIYASNLRVCVCENIWKYSLLSLFSIACTYKFLSLMTYCDNHLGGVWGRLVLYWQSNPCKFLPSDGSMRDFSDTHWGINWC